MSKINLIPRAYRIRKDQDEKIKKRAKRERIGESFLVRRAIDKEVGSLTN